VGWRAHAARGRLQRGDGAADHGFGIRGRGGLGGRRCLWQRRLHRAVQLVGELLDQILDVLDVHLGIHARQLPGCAQRRLGCRLGSWGELERRAFVRQVQRRCAKRAEVEGIGFASGRQRGSRLGMHLGRRNLPGGREWIVEGCRAVGHGEVIVRLV
jgi:hypothetical protein